MSATQNVEMNTRALEDAMFRFFIANPGSHISWHRIASAFPDANGHLIAACLDNLQRSHLIEQLNDDGKLWDAWKVINYKKSTDAQTDNESDVVPIRVIVHESPERSTVPHSITANSISVAPLSNDIAKEEFPEVVLSAFHCSEFDDWTTYDIVGWLRAHPRNYWAVYSDINACLFKLAKKGIITSRRHRRKGDYPTWRLLEDPERTRTAFTTK